MFGAGKTMCIALLASWFALRGHYVYYVSRQNTTIKAMADFVHQLLPRGPDDTKPIVLRLSSGSQARSGAGTQLDARDRDDNHTVFNAMQSSSWLLLGYTLPSFGIAIDRSKRRLIMQSSSFTTRHSKRRQ